MISFIVPAFNRVELFIKTIQSIFDRSKSLHSFFEIIVVDDCSSDDIYGAVISLMKLNSSDAIKYYRNSKNYGVNFSRNLGISKSKGDWIVLLDSDDLLEVELSVLKEIIEKNISSIYFFNCIDSQGIILHNLQNREIYYKDYVNGKFVGEALFVFKNDVFDLFRFDSNSRGNEGIVIARILKYYNCAYFFGSVVGRTYNISHDFRLSKGRQLSTRKKEIRNGQIVFLLENYVSLSTMNKVKFIFKWFKFF